MKTPARLPAMVTSWVLLTLLVAVAIDRHVYRTSVGLPDTSREESGSSMPVATDGGAVRQSLTVDVGVLDGCCVRVESARTTPGRLLAELRARDGQQSGQVLVRSTLEIRSDGLVCLSMPSGGLAVPANGQLWLTLRATTPTESAGLRLPVTSTKVLQQEALLVDREVWADLMVRVHAQAASRAARGQWPTWLPDGLRPRGMSAAVAALWASAFMAAIVWLPSPVRRTGRRGYLGLCAIAAGLIVLAGGYRLAARDGSLIEQLDEAVMTTTLPTLGQGFSVLSVNLGDGTTRAIMALPDSSIAWSIPAGARLFTTAAGLRQEAWHHNGDGATFEVIVVGGGQREVTFAQHLDPYHDPNARRWVPVEVDLSSRPWAGRVQLRVTAGPGGNAVHDAAMWRAPLYVTE